MSRRTTAWLAWALCVLTPRWISCAIAFAILRRQMSVAHDMVG
jgi:hypothetical protein